MTGPVIGRRRQIEFMLRHGRCAIAPATFAEPAAARLLEERAIVKDQILFPVTKFRVFNPCFGTTFARYRSNFSVIRHKRRVTDRYDWVLLRRAEGVCRKAGIGTTGKQRSDCQNRPV